MYVVTLLVNINLAILSLIKVKVLLAFTLYCFEVIKRKLITTDY